jgi:hypothetical protein
LSQIPFIDRLAKVTDDPIVQDANPVNIIGVGSHKDRRDGVCCINEMSVQFDPGHPGHLDIGDQACRFGKTRRCDEIGRRRESLGVVTQ